MLDFSYNVTEQVLARQQVERLNAELEDRVAKRSREALSLWADLLAATQAQLEEREAFYQIFAQTPATLCIQYGPRHRYEYVNAAYEHFFAGRTFLGRDVADVLPEAVGAGVVTLLDYVYQTGETYYGYELPVLLAQPDGSEKYSYFIFTYQALREHGEIVGISILAYDVAEQVLARQQREAQQRLVSAVFEHAPVAICVFQGADYVLNVVNPPMSALLGRPRTELVGRPFFDALPELRPQGLVELLDEMRRSGQPFAAHTLRETLPPTVQQDALVVVQTLLAAALRAQAAVLVEQGAVGVGAVLPAPVGVDQQTGSRLAGQ